MLILCCTDAKSLEEQLRQKVIAPGLFRGGDTHTTKSLSQGLAEIQRTRGFEVKNHNTIKY